MISREGTAAALRRSGRALIVASAGTLALASTTAAQRLDPDTVRAELSEMGRMWTFEYAPAQHFRESYGFQADAAWFERVRLSVLRIPGCSASFVSPNGLVATNHHCVRSRVSAVSRPGENLLDNGFIARTLAQERPIPDYRADQLIAIEDVTDEVFAALPSGAADAERAAARREATRRIEARLRERHAARAAGAAIHVEVVALYNGGRYSAYIFRRFTDVRLVAAAELQLGFFGGDADNFTYPRHALDFAFLRVYGADGRPYRPTHHLTWSPTGAAAGEVVFVVGNPGRTNRLATVAQLEYQREVLVPARIDYYRTRIAALTAFLAERPAEAEAADVRNRIFSLSNSLKAYVGRRAALEDAVIMARKRAAERAFRDSIQADAGRRERYGEVTDRLAALQAAKRDLASAYRAFIGLEDTVQASAAERRALRASDYARALASKVPADSVRLLADRIRAVKDQPPELQRRLLAARFADFLRAFGPDDPLVRRVLAGRTPEQAAAAMLERSALATAAATARALEAGAPAADDPGLYLPAELGPRYRGFVADSARVRLEEDDLAERLGRARFEVYGTRIPPDGTSSPRITDGVVRPYEYNGTLAPTHTNFFGMYALFHAHGPRSEWALHGRWLPPPAGLDLATPLNFVSTADTYGGNSGSPAITRDLALVGLNFDRNIEGLSRDFIYLPERGRNIMVDVRAILEALDDVYDADRLARELLTGRLFETEEAADRARRR